WPRNAQPLRLYTIVQAPPLPRGDLIVARDSLSAPLSRYLKKQQKFRNTENAARVLEGSSVRGRARFTAHARALNFHGSAPTILAAACHDHVVPDRRTGLRRRGSRG